MQALTNLVTNAAKFSPAGGTVRVSGVAHEDGVRLAVADHGPGIPLSFQPHVFEKFARARTEASASREGAGLGLGIAQQLVERMGGTIGFESEEGVGTTFWVDLPSA